MLSRYERLHLAPWEFARKTLIRRIRDFFRMGFTDNAKIFLRRIEDRSPVADEVWGTTPERRRFAKALRDIVKEEIGWPNANFLPEDPFELLTHKIRTDDWSWSYMEHVWILMRTEELTGLCIDGELWKMFQDMTFGEVVDYLFARRVDGYRPLWQVEAIPLGALEAQRCPALAAFLDIRAYLRTPFNRVQRKAIRPQARIRDALPPHIVVRLDAYVAKRFGVRPRLVRDPSCRDRLRLGLTAGLVLPIIVCVLGLVLAGLSWYQEGYDSSILLLPIFAVFFLLPGLLVTGVLASPHLVKAVYERVRFGKRPIIKTFADLIRWIQSERARLRASAIRRFLAGVRMPPPTAPQH